MKIKKEGKFYILEYIIIFLIIGIGVYISQIAKDYLEVMYGDQYDSFGFSKFVTANGIIPSIFYFIFVIKKSLLKKIVAFIMGILIPIFLWVGYIAIFYKYLNIDEPFQFIFKGIYCSVPLVITLLLTTRIMKQKNNKLKTNQ